MVQNSRTHAHVVGSMRSPDYLADARRALAFGETTKAEFKRTEDQAVDEAIAAQQAAGLKLINDGELRRLVFIDPLTSAIEGLGPAQHVQHWRKPDGSVVERTLPIAVVDKIRRVRSATAEEFTYVRARTKSEVKVTVPSPAVISAVYSKKYSSAAYPDFFDLVRDAAEVIRLEIDELVRLGATQIQIDAPELSFHADAETSARYADMGISTEQMLTEGMDMINDLANVPGVHFSLHICRGGVGDAWMAYGSYDKIAHRVFERASNIETFLLEYTSPGVGSFEPLAKAPDDKEIVLGLLSAKDSELESGEQLQRQIMDAAKYFPLAQLSLSSQCGFSNGACSPADQQAKLEQVTRVADRVWG